MPTLMINGQEMFHYTKEELEKIERKYMESLQKRIDNMEIRLQALEKEKKSKAVWVYTKHDKFIEYLLLLEPCMTTTIIVPEDIPLESFFYKHNKNAKNHKIVKILATRRVN